MFSVSKLILFFCLYLSVMSNATYYDAAFVREIVQDFFVLNCIDYATLAVLVYDTGKPSLIYANLSDSEIVLSLDKEVCLQVIQLWSTTCLPWRPRRITFGYSALTILRQQRCKPQMLETAESCDGTVLCGEPVDHFQWNTVAYGRS